MLTAPALCCTTSHAGEVGLVLPYLIRRAHENSAVMGPGVAKQRELLRRELMRRLAAGPREWLAARH
jgi:hypothetical protein